MGVGVDVRVDLVGRVVVVDVEIGVDEEVEFFGGEQGYW